MISVHRFPEKDLWDESEKYILNRFDSFFKKQERVVCFLSGGSVVRMYGGIAKWLQTNQEMLKQVQHDKLAFGQVDERKYQKSKIKYQKLEENLNAYQIEQTGLWETCEELGIAYYKISQERTLQEAVKQYEESIEKYFEIGLDSRLRGNEKPIKKIAILGIGEDGHTAGLLPGYEVAWNTDSWVAGYENDTRFRQRISLTPKALRALDIAIVVAGGEKKREAIRWAISPRNAKQLDDCPAAILQEIPRVELFTDRGI